MSPLINFLAGVVIGALVVWIVFRNKKNKAGDGSDLIVRQGEKYEENKRKVLEFVEQAPGRIGNKDIMKLLGVSSASATRYLDEMEKLEKVRQVGKVGEGVFYEKI